jgi:predicted nucleotidyltransferase
MTSSRVRIEIPRERIADFCRRHHIRWLALFGSVLRDDFRPDSDVDVLVEFEPDQRYTYFTLAQIEEDLSNLLGRKVDLHVRKSLHPFLRDKVLGQAEELYVGA